MSASVVLTHPASYGHLPPGHPERPERIAAIERVLSEPRFKALSRVTVDVGEGAVPGTEAASKLAAGVHDPGYVEALVTAALKRERTSEGGWIDADTYIGPGTLAAACAGVLSATEATRRVLQAPGTTAFSLCRPPGHHATRDTAMGFCLFNNAAVAAQAGIDAGLDRVAIVDFDVHHGNGTQDIFYGRADILYISTHQWPLYPGTGAADERGTGDGEGYTLNLPLPAGTGDKGYLEVITEAVVPALQVFDPRLLVISAGFDAHSADPLAQMEMSTAGYGEIAARLLAAADEVCEGRSVWVLEGGYDLDATAASVAACVSEALAAE